MSPLNGVSFQPATRTLGSAQNLARVEPDEAELEQFLASWSQGETGSMSLGQMLSLQASSGSVAPVPEPPKAADPYRQIEQLVAENRQVFQAHTPAAVDGWNIAH